jgi:hypothetical protein
MGLRKLLSKYISNNHVQPENHVQYLGVRGVTQHCVEAIVTILTSPYRCRAITVLFCEKLPEEDSYAVCFIIWDWLGHEITIVPDGFGTHNGSGGWGLSVVLALIQFYQIQLLEKWVHADQFERIANGYPTEQDCQQLHQPDFGVPSWPLHQREFGSELWVQISHDTSQFPFWLVEPELLEDIRNLEQNPGIAVFQAVRRLEIIVRNIGEYPAKLVGKQLIEEAMGESERGHLRPLGVVEDERKAWFDLFRGAIGAFKNPESHRDQKLSLEDAIGQILTVSMLVRKLKQDFPEKFLKEDQTSDADEEGE